MHFNCGSIKKFANSSFVNGLYFEKKVTPKQRALDNIFTVAAGKGHSLYVSILL